MNPTGRAHTGTVKDIPREANNSKKQMNDDNLDRSKGNENPSQVTIGSPGVQERINHSPSNPLVQTEVRIEEPLQVSIVSKGNNRVRGDRDTNCRKVGESSPDLT